MTIIFETTPRGMVRGAFADEHGSRCAIQEGSDFDSSPRLWFGVEVDSLGNPSCRMRLSREQVAELMPYLAAFVATGRLPERGDVVTPPAPAPGETLRAADVYGKLMAEFKRWNDGPEPDHEDALGAELHNAIRLGAIGAVSNVLAAIALSKNDRAGQTCVPLIATVNANEASPS